MQNGVQRSAIDPIISMVVEPRAEIKQPFVLKWFFAESVQLFEKSVQRALLSNDINEDGTP